MAQKGQDAPTPAELKATLSQILCKRAGAPDTEKNELREQQTELIQRIGLIERGLAREKYSAMRREPHLLLGCEQ